MLEIELVVGCFDFETSVFGGEFFDAASFCESTPSAIALSVTEGFESETGLYCDDCHNLLGTFGSPGSLFSFLTPFLPSSSFSLSLREDRNGEENDGLWHFSFSVIFVPLDSADHLVLDEGAMFSFCSSPGTAILCSSLKFDSRITSSLGTGSLESFLMSLSGVARGEVRGVEDMEDDLEDRSPRMDERLTGPLFSLRASNKSG